MTKPTSIPLASPDGEVLTYACGLCRRVHAGSSSWGPPDKKTRASLAESHRSQADSCCVCWKCKKIERGCYQCKACEATHYAEIEAQDASEEAKSEEQRATEAARAQLSWARGKAGPLATIVSSRYGWEGGKWLAFPGLVDEVDPDAFGDDPESHEFWTSDAAAFVGRGDTPDVALADLMKIANDNAPREEPAS